MNDEERFVLLERVVRREIDAQVGIERSVEEWPALIADTLLDYSVIEPLPHTPEALEGYGRSDVSRPDQAGS